MRNLFTKRKMAIFGVAVVVLSLFGWYRQTNAVSIYDNAYSLDDFITVISAPAASCPDINLSGSWYSDFLAITDADTHFESQATVDEYQDSLANTIANSGVWGVNVQSDQNAFRQTVTIYWAQQDDTELDWSTSSVSLEKNHNQDEDFYLVQIIAERDHDGTGGCGAHYINFQRVSSVVVSNDQTTLLDVRNVFLGGTYDTNYPVDYGGTDVRQTYKPPLTFYPEFEFIVENFDIRATYQGNIPYDYEYPVSTRWTMLGKDSNGAYVVQLDQQVLGEFDTYSYSTAQHGEYELKLEWLIDPPGQYPPPDTIGVRHQRLFTDGSIYSGNTSTNDCNGGICEQPSPYQDCSTLDLVCNFGNFQIWLRTTLITLFVPSSSFVNQYFNDLNNFIQEKLGLLIYPVTFLIGMLNDIIAAAGSPQCTFNPGGTFWGAPVQLDVCVVENNWPTVWTALSSIVRSLTIVALIVALYRKLLSILGSREHDKS